MTAENERRENKRVNLMIPVVFETVRDEVNLKKMDFAVGIVENLSAGGALIKSSVFLPNGATLSLQINISQTSPSLNSPSIKDNVRAVSRLVSFREQVGNKYRMGVKFTEIKPEDKKVISEIVNNRLKEIMDK